MKRRQLLALLAALPLGVHLGAHRAVAKSRLSKASVSAITDEVGATQADAMAFVKHYHLQWVDLRFVPGTKKEFATLTGPELKSYLAELRGAKLKVSLLHTSKPGPAATEAAEILGAQGIRTSDAGEWEPAVSAEPPARIMSVRVDALPPLNWRWIFETLQHGNYQGQICLKTDIAKADDAMRELMHYIGEL